MSSSSEGEREELLDDDFSFEAPLKSSWKHLFHFARSSHIFLLIASILSSILTALIIPVESYLYGKVFFYFTRYGSDAITSDVFFSQMTKYCTYIILLASISWLANIIFFLLWTSFGSLQAGAARKRLFSALLQRDIAWYDTRKNGVGSLLSRAHMHIEELQTATSTSLGFAVEHFTSALLSFALSAYLAWKLALVTLTLVPPTTVILVLVSRRIQPNIEAHRDKLDQASRQILAALAAIECVKCFNGQQHEVRKFASTSAGAAKCFQRHTYWNSARSSILRIALLGMFVLGFWYGSHLVNTRQKDGGTVLTTFWAIMLATQSLMQIAPLSIILQKGQTAGAWLHSITEDGDSWAQPNKHGTMAMLGRCIGDVDMKNVSFAYPSRPYLLILKDITVHFPAGSLTFLLGESGSGKSTVGHLLAGLYNATVGDITLDGIPYRGMSKTWLRRNVLLVEQKTTLFSGTVRRNLEYSRGASHFADDDILRHAMGFAAMGKTLHEMPDGLETLLESGGKNLSGGQKQCIALARAWLRDPQVVILDEATAAMDQATRSLVMNAIRHWRKGKTTIVITHDTSHITPGDCVYTLHEGHLTKQTSIKRKPTKIKPIGYGAFKDEFVGHTPWMTARRPPSTPILEARSNLYRLTRTVPTNVAENSFECCSPSPHSSKLFTELHQMNQSSRASSRLFPLEATDPPKLQPKWDTASAEVSYQGGKDNYEVSPRKPNGADIHRPFKNSTNGVMLETYDGSGEPLSVNTIIASVWPNIDRWDKFWLGFGTFFLAVYALATPAFSFILAKLMATFHVSSNQQHKAGFYSALMILIVCIDSMASFLYNCCLQMVGQSWVNSTRNKAFQCVIGQPRWFFAVQGHETVRLGETLVSKAENMQSILGRYIPSLLLAFLLTSISLTWGLLISWRITVVGLLMAPILYASAVAFEAIDAIQAKAIQDRTDQIHRCFFETFTNITTVKAFELERRFGTEFLHGHSAVIKLSFRRSLLSGFFFGLAESSIVYFVAAMLQWGSFQASRGTSVADSMTALLELFFGFSAASAMLSLLPEMGSARDAASRLLRLTHLPEALEDRFIHPPTDKFPPKGEIRLNKLWFRYPDQVDRPILTGLDLKIKEGECVALVGSSGSGKSTIASLLMKLYDPDTTGPTPQSPAISFGGNSSEEIDSSTLRKHVVLVLQAPVLFPLSILENIIYGLEPDSPYSKLDCIRAAANAAGIDEFIESLPHKYSTIIGDGGLGLSGGQAQRISLARALVRQPKVIILDEATSNLDEDSASKIRLTLRAIIERSRRIGADPVTMIIITHMQEMMRLADRVVVLENGKVVQQGLYEDLWASKGPFYRLMAKKPS